MYSYSCSPTQPNEWSPVHTSFLHLSKMPPPLSSDVLRKAKEALRSLSARGLLKITRRAPAKTQRHKRVLTSSIDRQLGERCFFIPFSGGSLSYQVRQRCPEFRAYPVEIVRGKVTTNNNYTVGFADETAFRVACTSVLFPEDYSVNSPRIIDRIIREQEPKLTLILKSFFPTPEGGIVAITPETKVTFFPQTIEDMVNVTAVCSVNRVYEATASGRHGNSIDIKMPCGPSKKMKKFRVPATSVTLSYSEILFKQAKKAVDDSEEAIQDAVRLYLSTGEVPEFELEEIPEAVVPTEINEAEIEEITEAEIIEEVTEAEITPLITVLSACDPEPMQETLNVILLQQMLRMKDESHSRELRIHEESHARELQMHLDLKEAHALILVKTM
jgi:hypothetical protein